MKQSINTCNIGLPKWILLVWMLFSIIGCEKWIDPAINIDPDRPSDVTIAMLLPTVEASIAYRVAGGNDYVRIQSIWLQQYDGIARQSMATSNYLLNPGDIYWLWSDAYGEILMNAKIIIEKSKTQNSPYNHAIGNMLSAFVLGQVTDFWNEAPWKQALQGQEFIHPEYDSQEFIYEEIFKMLEEAIGLLAEPEDMLGVRGDYLYDGDRFLWLKAAYAFKSRYWLHLSKRKGDEAFQNALEAANQSFESNDEDMQFNFGTDYTESNPVYQFMLERNDIRMGAYFIDLLKSYNDPRIYVYAFPDDNDEYTGSEPGSGNAAASWPGPAIISPDAPTYFITYSEVLFTKAECMYMLGYDESLVKPLLVDAVESSMMKNGVLDEDWMTGYAELINDLSGNDLLVEIMTQKYIATLGQSETYHSWRRTGIPFIEPNPNGAIPEIPRRFPYSVEEQQYNPNMPTGVTISDRVWWDE